MKQSDDWCATVAFCVAVFSFGLAAVVAENPFHEEQFVFDPEAESHGHVHASCIVECPNGDLRAVWYENGPELPTPPYYNERKDKSDDVRLGGARKLKNAGAWGTPFVMADTFGRSDNNPCMVVDRAKRLWLIYPTLLGVPDWTWGSALVRYRISTDYEKPGPPAWDTSDVLVPHPRGFETVIENTTNKWADRGDLSNERLDALRKAAVDRLNQPLMRRLGWMPRAHPLIRSDGALVLPLSNENFNIAVMAITEDGGRSWSFSDPVPEAYVTQPTLVEYPGGPITAFFRNSHPARRILRSDSTDGGWTWSPLVLTDLLHPGAGIEALLLRNGHLLMIYNDTERSPRDRLAVSISTDRGKTWKWTRHLENTSGSRFDYPSIIQAADGSLHATYSYNLKTIKHVHFNEAWVQRGDASG